MSITVINGKNSKGIDGLDNLYFTKLGLTMHICCLLEGIAVFLCPYTTQPF